MKLSLLLLFSIAISGFSNAQLVPSSEENLYDHMVEVNGEWAANAAEISNIQLSFSSDLDRISKHLTLVEQILTDRDVSHLTTAQRANRAKLLTSLKEYAAKKVFPTNLYHAKRTPYFIDDFGVHCAVGYLIQQSGHGDLAQKIRTEHNYDYIRDIKTKGVNAWAVEHGFTLDELAWIQPGYPAVGTYNTMGQGTNGTVVAMAKDAISGRIYVAGDFDELEVGNACGNVAYYENDQFYCLGGGLDAEVINDLFYENGKVIVTGKIQSNGVNYPLAIFENGAWSFMEIPTRANYTALTSIEGMGSIIDRQLVIYDQSSSMCEIWTLSASNWYLVAETNGPVNSIAWHDSEIVYAGMFDEFTVFDQGSTTLQTENIAMYNLGNQSWTTPTGQIADEIYKVKWFNGSFFFGGRSTFQFNQAFNSFGTLHNDTIAAIFGTSIFGQGQSSEVTIYDFESIGDSSVVACGDFTAGFMHYGNGVAKIDYTQFNANVGIGPPYETAWIEAQGDLGTASPYSLAVHQSELFVGGEIPALNNAVKFSETLKFNELIPIGTVVYPNPAKNILNIQSEFEVERVQIYDQNGRICHEQTGNSFIDVQSFSVGVYLVKIYFSNGQLKETKFVKD